MATILRAGAASTGATLQAAPAGPRPVVAGDPLLGQSVGPYRLLSLLGEGGMGRVYLGEHPLIGRKAAVKVLAPAIATDAEAVSRFFTEARAVNDIRHPNIVEVTDFGCYGGHHAIIMELLEGETLASRLARVRKLEPSAAVRIVKQCTSALAAAHERGLVHRDIKPENVFLREHPDYPDFVKLLDFGIAKLLAPEAPIGHRTKTGSVLGTPTYMSPEQCLGEVIDVRSDIYSLGIVMYEMLTGRVPFEADTLGRLIVCHVSEPPVPPIIVNPAMSRALNDVVLRAMQKRPQDRFQNVREFREALEQGLGTPPPVAAPRGPRSESAVAPDLGARLAELVRERLESGRVTFPDLPRPASLCRELVSRGQLSFGDAARILEQLPALRSRVMRLANSAAFPSRMPATTLEQAVARLGTQGLSQALLEFAARDLLDGRPGRVKDFVRRLWPHSLGTAVMTFELCQALELTAQAQNGYVGGLLHHAGRPLVAALLADMEAQMQRDGGRRAPLPDVVFLSVVESCHRAVGAALARHWEVAGACVYAIERAGQWDDREPRALSNVVTLAAALTERLGLGAGTGAGDPQRNDRLIAEGRARLGLDDAIVRQLSRGFKERITALSTIRG